MAGNRLNSEKEEKKSKVQNSHGFDLQKMLKTCLQMPRVFALVWKAQPLISTVFIISDIIKGLVPLAGVWSFKLLIDSLPEAVGQFSANNPASVFTLPAPIFLALALITISWFFSEITRPIDDYCREQLNDKLTRDINLLLMDKVNSMLDISILENPRFYDQLQRIQNDLTYKPVQMIQGVSQVIQSSIALSGLSLMLCELNPWLVLLIIAASMPKIVLQLKQMYQMWAVVQGDVPEVRRMRYFTGVLTNNADGKEVRLFGLGGYFRQNFLDMFKKFQETRSKMRNLHLYSNVFLAAFSCIGTIGSYIYTEIAGVNGKISVGNLAMYLGAIGQIEAYLSTCAFWTSETYKSTLYVNELFEFLTIAPAIENLPNGKATPVPIKKGIEFRNVTFKYPGSEQSILDGVSFTIAAGETLALVGENGAGKSTIVKLLTRLYDPSAGEILIDGIDLKELDAASWRSQISVVFQDYCRFQLTVRENIGVGSLAEMGNEATVKSAAIRGGADTFIADLKHGFDTMLGKMFESTTGNENKSKTGNESHKRNEEGNGNGNAAESGNANESINEIESGNANESENANKSASANESENRKKANGSSGQEGKDKDSAREQKTGTELSGGQWQKIALARAFMRSGNNITDNTDDKNSTNNGTSTQAQLLILDEPTASLDVQSEHDVYCRFSELTKDKMALLITHRFSTVRMADRILVLAKGKIIEEGSHAELMATGSSYAQMYNLQADRYK